MTKKAKKVPFDPKVFLATVNGGRSISKYRKNQKVFSQGKPADAVFYIQKGKVKITVVSEQGKEAVVAVLGPDEFCGEGCLTGQPVRLATATAMTTSRCSAIPRYWTLMVRRRSAPSRTTRLGWCHSSFETLATQAPQDEV